MYQPKERYKLGPVAVGLTRSPRKPKTVAVVQARYASTRLPGKVLLKLQGRTVLSRVLERVVATPGVDHVVCAVPDAPENDCVAEEALACGVSVYRGSENDVLDRTYRAAAQYSPRWVMRVTSDCPLVDSEVCGAVVQLLISARADYACNVTPPSFPHGLDCEVFTFAWLERAANDARKPSEREHVTQYMRTHPECRMVSLAGPGGDSALQRWTLDTPTDLEFLRQLVALLPEGRDGWNYRVPLAIVESHPELAAINAGYDRFHGLRRSLTDDEAAGFAGGRRDINLGAHPDGSRTSHH